MMQFAEQTRWINVLAGIGLTCLVTAVFFPVVGFEFVDLDVQQHLVDNPHIRGLSAENVKHILTSRCLTSYYPVRTLTYAADHQIWGMDPAGFKLTNGLIHLANVLLVFWLVLRLLHHPASPGEAFQGWADAPTAAFAAGIFGVHPVVVEPVAWVAGREELLMTLGALGCIHFHFTARRLEEEGGRTATVAAGYVGAALSCAAACGSNAVAAVIPALVTAWDALTMSKPTVAKILRGTAALWVLGIGTLMAKKVCELIEVTGLPNLSAVERLTLVMKVYGLNLKTLVWPADLTVCYPSAMPESFSDPGVLFGAAAFALTCVLLWKLRRQKLALFALVWFGLALGPSSQIMPHHIDRADRFLYLPLVGLVAAVALGLKAVGNTLLRLHDTAESPGSTSVDDVPVPRRRTRRRLIQTAAVAAGVLVLTVAVLASTRQLQRWRDSVAMWKNCVRLDPGNAQLRCGLADNLARSGQYSRAAEEYEASLRLAPDYSKAMVRFARLLATCEDQRIRDYQRAIRLAERAFERSPIHVRTLARVHGSFAESLAADGLFDQAIENYRWAVDLYPEDEKILLHFALLLATCREEELRRPDQAVELAQRACRMTKPPSPAGLSILAAAYAEAGQFEMAVATAERAIREARTGGDTALADEFHGPLKQYRDMAASASAGPGEVESSGRNDLIKRRPGD